jgi:hypothetical protein
MVKLKEDCKWTLIVIDDPLFLPGRSVVRLLEVITQVMSFHYVVLNDIVGRAPNGIMLEYENLEDETLEFDAKFTDKLSQVIQFEWGDFFLFENPPAEEWSVLLSAHYPTIIKDTDTTIRTIDNQYLYVYTPYEEIVKAVRNEYAIESIKTDSLANLEYPY